MSWCYLFFAYFFLFQSPNKDMVKKKKTTHKTAKSKKGINEVGLRF